MTWLIPCVHTALYKQAFIILLVSLTPHIWKLQLKSLILYWHGQIMVHTIYKIKLMLYSGLFHGLKHSYRRSEEQPEYKIELWSYIHF